MEPSLDQLQHLLSIFFEDKELLQMVFIHRSYLNEHKNFPLPHNERLEFLGDAVLELVVTDHLYRSYERPEGELTALRSSLVKGEMLAQISRDLGFSQYLKLSKGEANSGGHEKGYLLANVFEAFVGALYLDQGYDACAKFIHAKLLCRLPEIIEQKLYIDPKSRLQEYTQEKFGVTPAYDVISAEGPDHAKEFKVQVRVGADPLATGTGSSKQAAQIAAAESAILILEARE